MDWEAFLKYGTKELKHFDCLVLGGPFSLPREEGSEKYPGCPTEDWEGEVEVHLAAKDELVFLPLPEGTKPHRSRPKPVVEQDSVAPPPSPLTKMVRLSSWLPFRHDAIREWASEKRPGAPSRSIVVLLPLSRNETSWQIADGASPRWFADPTSTQVLTEFAGPGWAIHSPMSTDLGDAEQDWSPRLWSEGVGPLAERVLFSRDGKSRVTVRPILRPPGTKGGTGLLLAGSYFDAKILIIPTNRWCWPEDLFPDDAGQFSPLLDRDDGVDRVEGKENTLRLLRAAWWLHFKPQEEIKFLAKTNRDCTCMVRGCRRPGPGPWTLGPADAKGYRPLEVADIGSARLRARSALMIEALEKCGVSGMAKDELRRIVSKGLARMKIASDLESTNTPTQWLGELKDELKATPENGGVRICNEVLKRVFPHTKKDNCSYLPGEALVAGTRCSSRTSRTGRRSNSKRGRRLV